METKKKAFKVTSKKKYIPKIIWGAIILILAIFLGRVAIWEHNYYAEKEGSERAVSPSVGDVVTEVEVDETEITEEQIVEYTVAPEKPRYLTIEKLGVINARILEVGVNRKGQLDTPLGIYDAGWYNKSDLPGTGGTGIYDGHNGGPTMAGIFKQLPKLSAGDIITIETGDGRKLNYRVYDNVTVPLAKADAYMNTLYDKPTDTESISIISCTGEWSDVQKTYLSRQFVRATLI